MNRLDIKYIASSAVTGENKPRRNHSQVEIRDLETNTTKIYKTKTKAGEGSYGYVRIFECKTENGIEKIAVKATKDHEDYRHLSDFGVKCAEEETENEINMMQECYAHEQPYAFFHYTIPELRIGGVMYTGRQVMPFISGKKLADYAKKHVHTYDEMARLILAVSKENHRILTDHKIVHADAGERNILMSDDGKPHFIDFGLAYRLGGYASTGFIAKNPDHSDMAPEREGKITKLKAHPEQDVFSQAITFKDLIEEKGAKWMRGFFARYPVVRNFINNGSLKNWKQRPAGFEDFIQHLESNIDWKTHLPAGMEELVDALHEGSADKMLDHYSEDELAQLLHHLLWNGEYETAELLLQQAEIPVDNMFDGDNCLHIAARSQTISVEFFKTLLNSMPREKIVAAINAPNDYRETVVHAAAEGCRPELIRELLKFSPDLTKKDLRDQTAADTVETVAAPIINLFTFVQTEERLSQKKSGMFDRQHRGQELAAAKCMAKHVLEGSSIDEEFKQHRNVILGSKELAEIYQKLVQKEFLYGPMLPATETHEQHSRKRNKRH